ERRLENIASLSEHPIKVGSAPLQPTLLCLYRKRHVGRCRWYIERFEKLDELRIRPMIKDQEPGVDPVGDRVAVCIVKRDIDSMRMPTRIIGGLKQGNSRALSGAGKRPGGAEAGNAGTNDGNMLHSRLPSLDKTMNVLVKIKYFHYIND